jgi:hypothetical protein
MAAARPVTDVRELAEEARAAEAIWRLVIDATRDDFALLLRWWPDRDSAAPAAAVARNQRRAAPGGDAEQALEAIYAAYGGRERVPRYVHERLRRYARDQLGGRPWPARELAEHTDQPTLTRTRRREGA